jgi:hypothetical protein
MLHTNLPIYKKGYDLLTLAANSYYGLLRQATASHQDRAALSNTLRRRGHTVAGDLTKTFRRSS